jgi:hypothetical protein
MPAFHSWETDGSVRHALHVAVMRNHDVDTVASYDTAFGLFGVARFPLEWVFKASVYVGTRLGRSNYPTAVTATTVESSGVS